MNAHEIDLCGVVFSGEDGPLSFSRLIGWYDGSDIRGGPDSVPGAHGAFGRVDTFRDAKTITVEASLELADHGERVAEISRIVSALTGQGDMRVSDESGVWSRRVEVHNVDVVESHAIGIATFAIDVVAPDPVRYRDLLTAGPVGLPSQVGGLFLPASLPWDLGFSDLQIASVENVGSVPVLPVVTVTGSADFITVHGGPRRMEFGAFDGSLVFDSLQRRAFLNGADVTRDLVRRDWPIIPAGESQGFFFEAVNPSSDLSLTVEYRIGAW